MILHARHPSEVLLRNATQHVKGAGIRGGEIRFLLEAPAACKGIDSDWVVLEELGRYE